MSLALYPSRVRSNEVLGVSPDGCAGTGVNHPLRRTQMRRGTLKITAATTPIATADHPVKPKPRTPPSATATTRAWNTYEPAGGENQALPPQLGQVSGFRFVERMAADWSIEALQCGQVGTLTPND